MKENNWLIQAAYAPIENQSFIGPGIGIGPTKERKKNLFHATVYGNKNTKAGGSCH
jgi:hypothetical protein